jgi:hypothetical protein
VPYALVHQQVEVRSNALTVEVFYRNKRVASHVRSHQRGGFTTNPEHMPAAHRKHAEWTPERITAWAARTGLPSSARVAPAGMDAVRASLPGAAGQARRPRPTSRALKITITGAGATVDKSDSVS